MTLTNEMDNRSKCQEVTNYHITTKESRLLYQATVHSLTHSWVDWCNITLKSLYHHWVDCPPVHIWGLFCPLQELSNRIPQVPRTVTCAFGSTDGNTWVVFAIVWSCIRNNYLR